MYQLNPDVYVETGYIGGNVGCVRTNEGLILIDIPQRPRDAQTWYVRVTELTKQKVRYVINTGYNVDRMVCNCLFLPAIVIAHRSVWHQTRSWSSSQRQRAVDCLREMRPEAEPDSEDLRRVGPQLTFTERMMLYCGELELRLMHLGGQSRAAIGVHIPGMEIFFSGDVVVNGEHPDMTAAHTEQWLRVLTEIRQMRFKTLVPGHGPVCTREETQPLSAYIRLLRRRVRSVLGEHEEGKSPLDDIDLQELVGRFPIEPASQAATEKRICVSLRRVYDELKAG
jgi:cyclase